MFPLRDNLTPLASQELLYFCQRSCRPEWFRTPSPRLCKWHADQLESSDLPHGQCSSAAKFNNLNDWNLGFIGACRTRSSKRIVSLATCSGCYIRSSEFPKWSCLFCHEKNPTWALYLLKMQFLQGFCPWVPGSHCSTSSTPESIPTKKGKKQKDRGSGCEVYL